ncbi:MAG: Sec-independent protein translocase protein TatB [Acidiferrobacterales bacterium]
MFDIGIWELALIGVLALVILGPHRLPEVARTAGKWVGRMRQFVASVKSDFDNELRTEELTELRKLHTELNETRQLIQQSSSDAFEGLQQSLDADRLAADVEKPVKRKPAASKKAKKRKTTTRTTPRKKAATKRKTSGTRRTRSR